MSKTVNELASDAKKMMRKYSKSSMALTLATFLQYRSLNLGDTMRQMLDRAPNISRKDLQYMIDNPELEGESHPPGPPSKGEHPSGSADSPRGETSKTGGDDE